MRQAMYGKGCTMIIVDDWPPTTTFTDEGSDLVLIFPVAAPSIDLDLFAPLPRPTFNRPPKVLGRPITRPAGKPIRSNFHYVRC